MPGSNQASGGGQGQPAATDQAITGLGQSTGAAPATSQPQQGLMGMAHVAPSGTEYKNYDPVNVKSAATRNDR